MSPKGAGRIGNSVDPDQIGVKNQSDLGQHYLLRPICPYHYSKRKCYGILALDRISYAMA